MGFECVSRTHVGLRRKVNEDSVLARTDIALWAVADGMGGHEAGEVASAMVVEALGQLAPGGTLDEFVGRAVDALIGVNHALIALAHKGPGPRVIGSTIVGVAVVEDKFRCFWAGDSRAYRVRGERIVQLSRDHSLVEELMAAGMLSPAEAIGHPNANVITRAVGVVETLAVETSDGEARVGDLFLIASDGLTRLVDDDELLDELVSRPLGEVADRLIDTVLARGAPDNVSLVIVRVT